jgi:hypothetical protein
LPTLAYDYTQGSRSVGASLAFIAIGLYLSAGACVHAQGFELEPDPIALTVLASDSTLLSAMSATVGDFGGTGRADPSSRTWRSSVMQVGSGAAFGFRMRGVPPGTTVIVAQIADTTGGMRRVLFHASIELVGGIDNQQRLTVARAALRLFVSRLQRRLAIGG